MGAKLLILSSAIANLDDDLIGTVAKSGLVEQVQEHIEESNSKKAKLMQGVQDTSSTGVGANCSQVNLCSSCFSDPTFRSIRKGGFFW